MIEFNLIPSIKKEFLKIQFLKKIVVLISVIASSLVLVVFIVLFVLVSIVQKNQLNNVNQTVQSDSSRLTGNTNLNKILTIQNQLTSLPNIESKSPSLNRLFGYLNQLTPTTAYISQINLGFSNNSFTIQGSSNSLSTVNKFVDTLKYTNFYFGKNKKQTKLAFSNVLLSSFSYDSTSSNPNQDASYSITFNFNSDIFNNQDNVHLNVPNLVTTRSILDQPTVIFKNNPNNIKASNK